MSVIDEGVALFDCTFIQTEELINLAETANEWQPGPSEGQSIYAIDPNSEIHMELLKTFLFYIMQYREEYPHLNVANAEQFKVIKYDKDGSYPEHIDNIDNSRTLVALLYLNDDFKGGLNVFPKQKIEIEPQTARMVLYPASFVYPSEIHPITDRTKYMVVGYFR
jgi:hypothetical protein